jgi:hypothetical protein
MACKRCSLKSCNRPHSANGYCSGHNLRVYHTGDPQEDKPLRKRRRGEQPKNCAVIGCQRTPVGRGYCAPHRWRVAKYGDPLAHIPIRNHGKALKHVERKGS